METTTRRATEASPVICRSISSTEGQKTFWIDRQSAPESVASFLYPAEGFRGVMQVRPCMPKCVASGDPQWSSREPLAR